MKTKEFNPQINNALKSYISQNFSEMARWFQMVVSEPTVSATIKLFPHAHDSQHEINSNCLIA